jgi:hypothetical protein
MVFSLFSKPKPAPVRERSAKPKVMPTVHVGGISTVTARSIAAQAPIFKSGPLTDEVKKQRRVTAPNDAKLKDGSLRWLEQLPKQHRPLKTCQAYPHVVNHLAGWWDIPEGLSDYFEDLLNSKRTGRQGFPLPVKAELETLRAYARVKKLLIER